MTLYPNAGTFGMPKSNLLTVANCCLGTLPVNTGKIWILVSILCTVGVTRLLVKKLHLPFKRHVSLYDRYKKSNNYAFSE